MLSPASRSKLPWHFFSDEVDDHSLASTCGGGAIRDLSPEFSRPGERETVGRGHCVRHSLSTLGSTTVRKSTTFKPFCAGFPSPFKDSVTGRAIELPWSTDGDAWGRNHCTPVHRWLRYARVGASASINLLERSDDGSPVDLRSHCPSWHWSKLTTTIRLYFSVTCPQAAEERERETKEEDRREG